MERKLYQKAEDSLQPGTWQKFPVPNGYSILFMDTFGHIGSLDDHQIGEDGIVNPSVVCPQDGCSFHEWLILESFDLPKQVGFES